MAEERVNVRITATDNASGPIRKAAASMDDLGDNATTSAVKAKELQSRIDKLSREATESAAKIELLKGRIDAMGDKAVTSAAKVKALESQISKLNRQATIAGGKNGIFGRLFNGGKDGDSNGGMAAMVLSAKFMRFFKIIMIPTILDAVGAVATLGSALVAWATAAVGAWSPIVGLLGAIPGLVAPLVQGFAAVKLGFSGIGDAIKALSNPEASPEEIAKAMEGLGPKTQKLAKNIVALQKPFAKVKKSISNELAPGFIQLTDVAKAYLPMLRKSLVETARSISGIAGRLGSFFKTAQAQSDIRGIMSTNNTVLQRLGSTVVPMFKMLMNIMVAATPMVTKLVEDFVVFFNRIAASTDNRNGLLNFFEKTYTVTKGTIKVLADLSMALYNVFKIGSKWGGEMGRSLIDATEQFREWTESARGIQSITKWFEKMRPIAAEVGGIFVDLSKGLASISMDDTVLKTLQTIRYDTVPALVGLLQGSSGKFVSQIARIVGTLASIMTEFKAFPVILEVIANLLETIAGFIQGLPGPIKQTLGYMVTMSSVIKFGGMIGFFKLFGDGKAAAGAAKTATGVGLLTKAFSQLKVGLINVGYVMGQVLRGKDGLGTGVSVLGKSAKETGSKMMGLMSSTKVGVVALAAVALAAIHGAQEISNMKDQVKSLNDELARTGSTDAFKANVEKANEIRNTGWKDWLTSGEPFTDAGNLLGYALGGFGYKSWLTTGQWGGRKKTSIEEQVQAAKDLDKQRAQMEQLQQKVADSMFAGYGKGAKNALPGAYLGNEFLATQEQVDFIQKIAEEAGVNWQDPIEKVTQQIREFKTVNYDSLPAVRDLANGLDTMADEFADAGTKIDAYNTVMQSMQDIWTGRGKTNALFEVTRGQDALNQAMQTATVTIRKHNVYLKTSIADNIALNDALNQQATAITNVAEETYKRTHSVDKSMKSYKNQYDKLVGQLTKGLGIKENQAIKMLDKYLARPKEMKLMFKDEEFRKWLKQAPRSYDDIRRYFRKHPLTTKVEIQTKGFKKGKLGIGGLSDASLKSGTVTQTTNYEVPGLKDAVEGTGKYRDNVKWINNNAANPNVKTNRIRSANTVANTLLDTLVAISNIDIDFTSSGGKKNKGARFGGPVFAGEQYTVGEVGPEAFVGRDGAFEMIGVGGREQRTFPQDGIVVPNDALPRRSASSGEYSVTTEPVQAIVKIGTINAHSEIDVVKAVKKGIRDAERNARERR